MTSKVNEKEKLYVAGMKHSIAADAAALLNTLADSDGLAELITVGERMFENPVLIADKSWSVLAMSEDVDIPEDVQWGEFSRHGTLTLGSISLNIGSKLTQRIETSSEPFIWEEPGMRYRRLIAKSLTGGRTVATVSVVEYHKTIAKDDPDRLALFSMAVAAQLQKAKYEHYSRGLIYEDFLVGVLEGRISGRQLISGRARSFNLPLGEGLRVFILGAPEGSEQMLASVGVKGGVESILRTSSLALYGSNLLALKSYGAAGAQSDTLKKEVRLMQDFLEEQDLYCGVSRPGEGAADIRTLYTQALGALRMVSKAYDGRRLAYYDDAALYLMTEMVHRDSDARELIHPGIFALMEYDEVKGSQLMLSLKTWLASLRNTSEAAEDLGMHRNSLLYQLKKVEEIGAMDLSDANLILHLEMSFKFLEYGV